MAQQGQGILIKSLLSIQSGSYVLLRAKRHRRSLVTGSLHVATYFANIFRNVPASLIVHHRRLFTPAYVF